MDRGEVDILLGLYGFSHMVVIVTNCPHVRFWVEERKFHTVRDSTVNMMSRGTYRSDRERTIG